MLERAFGQIPKTVFEKARFQMPEADVVVVGNRTTLRNFRSIANDLNREPDHLLKFLLRELGASGNIEGTQAVFQGRFTKSMVDERIRRYAEEFVLCKECGKPDIKLIKQERFYVLRCEVCGARAPVRSV